MEEKMSYEQALARLEQIIRAMENPMFANLIEATWKLIEHEKQ